MRTLIIEDNKSTALYFSALLKNEKVESDILNTGKSAIKKIGRQVYNLVLLDLELPDVYGLRILKEIRKKYSSHQLPVMVVSALIDDETITEALKIGANDFIEKPFKDVHFKLKIRNLLQLQSIGKELEIQKNQFETVLNQSPLGISIINQNGQIEWRNQSYDDIFNLGNSDNINFTKLIHPEDLDKTNKQFSDLLKGKTEKTDAITRILLPENKIVYFRSIATKIINNQGETKILTFDEDITKKRADEKELLRLNAAIEQSFNTIVLTDVKGNIEYVNEAFTKTTGYTREEAIGQNPRILKSELHSEEHYKNIWDTILSGNTWQGELYNRRKDGSFYWEKAILSPIKDRQGNIIQFLAIKEDISKQKESELKLIENHFLLNEFSKIAKIGGWKIDLRTNELAWTEETYSIHEVNKDYIPTIENGIAFYDENSIPIITKAVNTAIKDGLAFDHDLVIITAKGNKKIVRAKGEPIYKDGEIIEIRGIFQDISERSNAEQAIKDSEAKFKTLFNSSPEAILLANMDTGIIEDANVATEKLFETKLENIIGLHFSKLHPQDETGEVKKSFKKAPDSNTFGTRKIFRDIISHRKTKKIVEILDNKIRIKDQDYVLGVFRDITEQKNAENKIKENEQKLVEVINAMPDIFFHKNLSGIYENCNENFANFVGQPVEKIIGKSDYDLFDKKTADKYRETDKQVMEDGIVFRNEEWATYPDGRHELLDTIKTPYYNKEDELIGIFGLSREITESYYIKIREESNLNAFKLLSQTASKLLELKNIDEILKYFGEVMLQLVPEAYHVVNIFNHEKGTVKTIDVKGIEDTVINKVSKLLNFSFKNKEYVNKLNTDEVYPPAHLRKFEKGFVELINVEFGSSLAKLIQKIANINEVYGVGIYPDKEIFAGLFIFTHHEAKLRNRWVIEIFVKQLNARLNILLTDNKILDQNSRLKAKEIELQNTIEAKEVLLKEVHHRVKNNLQTISSLLNQQQLLSDDHNTKIALKDSINRVSTMALIHQFIYKSSDLEKINMQNYLNELIGKLMGSYREQKQGIQLQTNIEDIYFDIDKTIPVALTINEILSNIFKYAFSDVEKGIIDIQFKAVDKGKVKLLISDNGKGFPLDFKPEKSKTLGMYLIKNFVERQLKGDLKIVSKPDHGVQYFITF